MKTVRYTATSLVALMLFSILGSFGGLIAEDKISITELSEENTVKEATSPGHPFSQSTWVHIGVVLVRLHHPTYTTCTAPTEEAEVSLKTSPTYHSGSRPKQVTQLMHQSTDVPTFKTLQDTLAAFQLRSLEMPHPDNITQSVVNHTTVSTLAEET